MKLSRRAFLGSSALAAGGALVIGFSLRNKFQHKHGVQASENPFDAWIRINPDNSTQVIFAQSEMGQGVYTALPMILADEAELDWNRVEIVQSDLSRGTGGSGSVMTNFLPLRRAGAAVRTVMIAAAAHRFGVPESQCTAQKSEVVVAQTGQRASYGELVEAARRLPMPDPAHVKLKDPGSYKLIGRETQHLDAPAKCSGSARFGLDVRVPGMVFAVIARCPTFGGSPARFDASKALRTPGVLQVFEIPAVEKGVFTAGGIAVVAQSTWAAMQGRKALDITWNHGPHVGESSSGHSERMRQLLNQPPMWSSKIEGPDPDHVLGAARVETVYEFPFLSHACMEPMNVTLHVNDDKCEVWCPSQSAEWTRTSIATELGIAEANVTVHTTFMGGGFGRRFMADFQTEAAQIARHVGSPVQLVWTREDDMTHDFYRPAGMRRMRGAVDAQGNIVAWTDFLANPSIAAQWHTDRKIDGGELPEKLIYSIPHVQTRYSLVESAVPRAWWRSVENSFNGFAVESFVDELAHAARMDPYEFRRRLLHLPPQPDEKPSPDEAPFEPQRLIAVLDLAAQKAGWGKPLGPHRGRGIACTKVYGYLAQVAEVTVERDNIRVDRLITAVDCGQVVNPNGARSQLEGGMLFTLSSILKESITIRDGAVEQQNFNDYSVLRMPEAPTLETWFVESHAAPHGLGEAAVGLTGPAVANAIFAATGKRMHRMPFRMDEVKA
jgi:isoquinoline 1-oxidoreductase beta subunit